MSNITSIVLSSGNVTSSGTFSTLDNTFGTAGTSNTNVISVQGIASGVAQPISGTVSVASISASVQVAGTVSVTATVPVSGTFWQTTQPVSLATSTTPLGTVTISNVNPNGRTTTANSAPVVLASQIYNTVPASATSQILTGGASGAVGDWLDFLLVIPGSLSAGAVSIGDGTASSVTVFSGGATSVASLVPFTIPVRAISANGPWKVTTGTSVTALAVGNFH